MVNKMINEKLREYLNESLDSAYIFDNPSFDNSIIGISTDGKVVYDFRRMIFEMTEEDAISEEEAIEFIEYNTLRVMDYMEENMRPIIVDTSMII